VATHNQLLKNAKTNKHNNANNLQQRQGHEPKLKRLFLQIFQPVPRFQFRSSSRSTMPVPGSMLVPPWYKQMVTQPSRQIHSSNCTNDDSQMTTSYWSCVDIPLRT
jgi:hypothetical protein